MGCLIFSVDDFRIAARDKCKDSGRSGLVLMPRC